MHYERKARFNMENTRGEVYLCSGKTLLLWEGRFTTKNEINLSWRTNDEQATALGKVWGNILGKEETLFKVLEAETGSMHLKVTGKKS